MFKKFLPKAPKFFDLLCQLAEKTHSGVKIFKEMITDVDSLTELASQVHIIENQCDEITHSIMNELNETFVTPIDREDIHALANSLDNIIDSVDSIAIRLSIYKIKTPIAFGSQLIEILQSQTSHLVDIVNNLKNKRDSFDKLISIRNLETQGDMIFREAISQLFDTEKDIIELIKKKEILENIEKSVDHCQTATIVIEGILIKNV